MKLNFHWWTGNEKGTSAHSMGFIGYKLTRLSQLGTFERGEGEVTKRKKKLKKKKPERITMSNSSDRMSSTSENVSVGENRSKLLQRSPPPIHTLVSHALSCQFCSIVTSLCTACAK